MGKQLVFPLSTGRVNMRGLVLLLPVLLVLFLTGSVRAETESAVAEGADLTSDLLPLGEKVEVREARGAGKNRAGKGGKKKEEKAKRIKNRQRTRRLKKKSKTDKKKDFKKNKLRKNKKGKNGKKGKNAKNQRRKNKKITDKRKEKKS